MKVNTLILSILLTVTILSCSNTDELDDNLSVEESLIQTLNENLNKLNSDPLLWEDTELQFVNSLGEKAIVGLGEATHGTSEFFKAKHRIFRYLVENHDFKIFAIEADFGESILINEALQEGDCSKVRELMEAHMHFWTWRTTEVEALLDWMCTYNIAKEDNEKLQYFGVDCSFNTFHPDMVLEYLHEAEVPFIGEAEQLLKTAKESTESSFEDYTEESFNAYLNELSTLQESINEYKDVLVEKSSIKEFELNSRLMRVITQASEVRRIVSLRNFTNDPRDPRMAENALWLQDFFEGEKIAVWAHNGHLDNNVDSESMGYHLSQELGSDYGSIAFAFSTGSFTAIGQGGLGTRFIESEPIVNSLNYYLSQANESNYAIGLQDLSNNSEWNTVFNGRIEYLFIGSVFDRAASRFYQNFEPNYFDELIYIDRTKAADNF